MSQHTRAPAANSKNFILLACWWCRCEHARTHTCVCCLLLCVSVFVYVKKYEYTYTCIRTCGRYNAVPCAKIEKLMCCVYAAACARDNSNACFAFVDVVTLFLVIREENLCRWSTRPDSTSKVLLALVDL